MEGAPAGRRNGARPLGSAALDGSQFPQGAEEGAVVLVSLAAKGAPAIYGRLHQRLKDFLFEEAFRIELTAEFVLQIVKARRDQFHMSA